MMPASWSYHPTHDGTQPSASPTSRGHLRSLGATGLQDNRASGGSAFFASQAYLAIPKENAVPQVLNFSKAAGLPKVPTVPTTSAGGNGHGQGAGLADAQWQVPTVPTTSAGGKGHGQGAGLADAQWQVGETPAENPQVGAAAEAKDGTAPLDDAEVTTLMFRSLPRKYTVNDLAAEIQEHVNKDCFDFVSLPWDAQKPSNLGYAFVNFTHPTHAAKVRAGMDDQPWRLIRSPKKARILTAYVQGLSNNVLHCAGNISPEVEEAHYPIVVYRGSQINFRTAIAIFTAQASEAAKEEASLPLLGSPCAPKTGNESRCLSSGSNQSGTCSTVISHSDLRYSDIAYSPPALPMCSSDIAGSPAPLHTQRDTVCGPLVASPIMPSDSALPKATVAEAYGQRPKPLDVRSVQRTSAQVPAAACGFIASPPPRPPSGPNVQSGHQEWNRIEITTGLDPVLATEGYRRASQQVTDLLTQLLAPEQLQPQLRDRVTPRSSWQ